jgi:hypothetical protein
MSRGTGTLAFTVACYARRERLAAQKRGEAVMTDPGWRELLRILDEEVQRLPERYRSPLPEPVED